MIAKNLVTDGLNQNYKQDVLLFNTYFQKNGLTLTDALQAYFTEIQNQYRPATIARKKQALKAAIKSQIGNNLTIGQAAQINAFFEEIKTPKPQKQIMSDQTITEQELKMLIQESGHKTGLIIRALYMTACRVSELIDIKLTNCTVRKDCVIIRIIGKGGKERTVYLDTPLFNEIKKTYKGKNYLFETNEGNQISRITVYTMIKRAGKHIGRPDIHPHTIRHSFATNRLEELGIDSIGAYLGHATIATTAQYYLHNVPTAQKIVQGAL